MRNFLILPYKQPKAKYRQYTIDDIRAMQGEDEEMVNFAYDTAIDRMQEIRDDVKIVNTRTTLLLGYLAAMVAGLLVFLFRETPDGVVFFFKESTTQIEQNTKDFALILLGFYFGNIFLVAMTLINPTFLTYANNRPEYIMAQRNYNTDIKLIKVLSVKGLTENIEINMKRLYIFASWLRACIFFTFIAPFIAFAWAYFA